MSVYVHLQLVGMCRIDGAIARRSSSDSRI